LGEIFLYIRCPKVNLLIFNHMKKALLLMVVAVMSSTMSFAQLPAGSYGQDFTITDQFGVSHNLYNYLDQGYTVYIDVSATWCGPCWNFHNSGALDNLYANHGPAGAPGVSPTTTDEVMVIWIDGDGTTTDADMAGTGTNTQGNWLNPAGTPIEFPMANPAAALAGSINNDYAIGYFPTIYRVCPNRIVTEVGQLDGAGLYATLQECPPPAFQANDASMLSYNGDVSTCGNVNVAVTIQNNGTDTLTACTITVTGGIAPLTFNWTGNLATYAVETVNVGTVALTGAATLNVAITSADDNTANNATAAPIAFAADGTTHVKIDILFDAYPEECSWSITDDAGNVVASADYNPTPRPADYSTKIENVYLPSTGCYFFNATDAYGDGFYELQYTGGVANGHMFVTTVNDAGATFSSLVNYDGTYNFAEVSAPSNVNTVVGIEEVNLSAGVSVYPNPANDFINVAYGLTNNSVVTVDVINVLGERVMTEYVGSQAAGNYTSRLDVSNLSAGVYMLNVTINGTVNTVRVSVK
jgi:hypothetical protein